MNFVRKKCYKNVFKNLFIFKVFIISRVSLSIVSKAFKLAVLMDELTVLLERLAL